MRIVRITVISLVSLLSLMSAHAELPEALDFQVPESVDGVEVLRPGVDAERINVSDLMDFPGLPTDTVFVRLVKSLRERFSADTEDFARIDFADRRMAMRRSVSDDSDAGVEYNYSVSYQPADGMLSFMVSDISVSYKEKGILPRTIPLEKLKPKTNRRHRELYEGFVLHITRYIEALSGLIRDSDALPVTHWDELAGGRAVKGMNTTEIILLKGRPNSERRTGSRLKWMYGNEDVIVFTDGIATAII